MELLTLLKANIKHKKGSFISVAILTLLIVTVASTAIGVLQNYRTAQNKAIAESSVGNSNIIISSGYLSDELFDAVQSSSLVDRVEVAKALKSTGTIETSTISDYNLYFLLKLDDKLRLFNDDHSGFADSIPALGKDEVYLPYGLHSKLSLKTGDTVTIPFGDNSYEFTIKGFVQEPAMGTMTIGWKYVFINEEDYNEISNKNKENAETYVDVLRIFKADSSMSDSKFQRELNLETGISRNAVSTLTKQQILNYTGMFVEIVCNVVLGFSAVLFVIVLVVTAHSIITECEIEYVNLGILKSQGFTTGNITNLFMLQYLLAELIGSVLGVMLSVPLERIISRLFMSITALLPENTVPVVQGVGLTAAIIVITAALIFAVTRKVTHISPVRAISGGSEEVYFACRLNAPIAKKALTSSIALRSFTSAKRRYVGIVFITALLTFFAVTVNILGGAVRSRSSMEAMGTLIPDLTVASNEEDAAFDINEIEDVIEKHSAIKRKYYLCWGYLSLNGESLMSEIYQYPEYIPGILKGRAPLYDNEIIVTRSVADDLELKMGDTVRVCGSERDSDYLITGFYQSSSDNGKAFAMSYDGARKVTDDKISYYGIVLENEREKKAIADELNSLYGNTITVRSYDWDSAGHKYDAFHIAVLAIRILIYVFTIVFSLVTVIMICTKAFTQERTDIGIYKALGFTVGKLRLQFAVRFFIVSLVGGVIGAVAGSMFSVKLLDLIFSLFGVSKVVPEYTAFTFIGAVAFVSLCVLVFSFIVSGKVKRVEIRELVTE